MDDLCELIGQTLVFDTSPDMPSAADDLAGLVFEMLAPDPHLRKPLPRKRGATAQSSSSRRAGIIPKAIGLAVAPRADATQVFTRYLSQEALALAVRKLFPDSWLHGFQFPMMEDIINAAPFDLFR